MRTDSKKHEWHCKKIWHKKVKSYVFTCAKCSLKIHSIKKDIGKGYYIYPEYWSEERKSLISAEICHTNDEWLCRDIIL